MKFAKPAREFRESETIATRLPLERARAFQGECKKDGVTLAEGLRQLIENFLKLRGK